MKTPHYQFFLALEREFEESLQFVELDPKNSATFSTAYLKMLFGACVEIEAVLKEISKRNATAPPANNIDQLRASILGVYPKFYDIELQIPRYSLSIKPWASWSNGTNPDWWRAYNKAKHNRQISYDEAKQENVVDALAALFAGIIYLYAAATPRVSLEVEPRLFHYDNLFPAALVFGSPITLP